MLDRVGKAGANTTSGWCWRRAGPVSDQVSWRGARVGFLVITGRDSWPWRYRICPQACG